MSQPVPLTDLRDIALDYADQLGSKFPNEKTLLHKLNVGLAEIHEMMANAKNSDYFR